MNRREALKTLGVAGLSLAASSHITAPSEAEPTPQTHKPAVDPSLPPPPGASTKHDMRGYGIPAERQQIAMLIYPDMTTLELVGPHQILSRMGNVDIHLIWKTHDLVTSDDEIALQPTKTFAECPDNLTVLFVPGGSGGVTEIMNDPAVLEFLIHKAKTAKYITSVGTGSLVLGAAGLLQGYKATSHWMMRDFLAGLGAKPVKARVVEDRNRVTGAGVTAGIDFALHLTTLLRNEKMTKALQLTNEYDPQPPYQAGTPNSAPLAVTQMEWAMNAGLRDEMREAIQQVRKRWKG